jgi:signal transduction histidine kinase
MTLGTDHQLNDRPPLSATSLALLGLREEVLDYWERLVREQIADAWQVSSPVLVNTLPAFLENLAEALTASYPRDLATSNTNAAAVHGGERARMTPFRPDQLVHEYQLFKTAVLEVCDQRGVALTPAERRAIDRSIESAVRESVRQFTRIHMDMRERLAAGLSHDMRTPLSVIVHAAELIALTPDIGVARRAAGNIQSSAARLERMMEELLDALTIQRDAKLQLQLSEFEISELVQEVGQEFDSLRPGSVEISGGPVRGYWCRNALRRALENLLVNAVKYGDGQPVGINIDHAHGRMILSVHNTGRPIPSESHQKIFEYLQREGGSAADGWGIGLPFVRSVAESHGGSVAVDSSAALGTTFLIDLPVDCRPFVQP